jgi:hypothetical protein
MKSLGMAVGTSFVHPSTKEPPAEAWKQPGMPLKEGWDTAMTFSVVVMENNRAKVIGTLWASDESSAQALAPAIVRCEQPAQVCVRRAEEREIPLRFCESNPIPVFC